jgi:uncharacterized membrane protein SirB2
VTFLLLKSLHMTLAGISVLGFVIRGVWMVQESRHLDRAWIRTAPHVVDTLLLLSGLGLAVVWQISPLAHPWFAAKLVAIVAYILAGSVALKRGRSRKLRITSFLVALLCAGYVVMAATTKSPLPAF